MVDTALVLAAGFGTRLGALTRNQPKAMVPVAGRPMIGRVLDALYAAGCRRFVINTHYHRAVLWEWLQDQRWPEAELIESYEPEIMGTGGAIAQALPALGQRPFWIHNCDVLSDVDLAAVADSPAGRAVLAGDAAALLVLREDESAYTYGSFEIDNDNTIVRMLDAGATIREEQLMFTGIHLAGTGAGRWVKSEFGSVFGQWYLPAFRQDETFKACVHKGYWADLGTPASLAAANARFGAISV